MVPSAMVRRALVKEFIVFGMTLSMSSSTYPAELTATCILIHHCRRGGPKHGAVMSYPIDRNTSNMKVSSSSCSRILRSKLGYLQYLLETLQQNFVFSLVLCTTRGRCSRFLSDLYSTEGIQFFFNETFRMSCTVADMVFLIYYNMLLTIFREGKNSRITSFVLWILGYGFNHVLCPPSVLPLTFSAE